MGGCLRLKTSSIDDLHWRRAQPTSQYIGVSFLFLVCTSAALDEVLSAQADTIFRLRHTPPFSIIWLYSPVELYDAIFAIKLLYPADIFLLLFPVILVFLPRGVVRVNTEYPGAS